MSDTKQQGQMNDRFLKTALVLWALALCGVVLVLPYVATLENKALTTVAARTHFTVAELLALSVAQTAVLLAIAVVVGLWAARKLGLGTPLIAAFLSRGPAPETTRSTLVIAGGLGIVTGLALMMLDHWIFAPIP